MRRHHTLLVVEDNASLRKLVTGLLEAEGYKVLAAAGAAEALEASARYGGVIHALLADIILHGPMDGLELGSELRRIRPALRCLYMSGYAGTFADRLELEALSDFFLAKPFTAESLLGMVEAGLAGASSGRAASPPRGRATLRR